MDLKDTLLQLLDDVETDMPADRYFNVDCAKTYIRTLIQNDNALVERVARHKDRAAAEKYSDDIRHNIFWYEMTTMKQDTIHIGFQSYYAHMISNVWGLLILKYLNCNKMEESCK